MGYCCFCIPLHVYGVFLGCIQFVFSLYKFIEFCRTPEDDKDTFFVWIGVMSNGVLGMAAILLIIGSIQLRQEYITPYLVLVAVTFVFLTIAMCASYFDSSEYIIYFLVQIIAICLLTFPIYVLYLDLAVDEV